LRIQQRGWWLYLALMAPVSLAYLVGPHVVNSGPVFNAIGFSACTAVIVGVRLHKPATRWAWYLIAFGQALFVAGDVIAYNYKTLFGVRLPFPSAADPLYLAVYPLTVVGLLLLIRKRDPGRDSTSLLDSLIVTIGLALLSWVFLMAPYAHDSSLHLGTKVVSIAYPLMDVLVLGVALRMAVAGGRRGVAYFLIIGAIAALLITDAVYGWIQLHGLYTPGDPLDGGWILYYLVLGTAALHPSMATVSEAAPRVGRLTRTRLFGIATAVLIAPVLELVKFSGRDTADAVVIGSATIILFALVVIRMIGLVQTQQAAADRERTMRQATDAMVTATSPSEINVAAQTAAAVLVGADAVAVVLGLQRQEGAIRVIGGGGAEPSRLISAQAPLAGEIASALARRESVPITDARAQLGLDISAAPGYLMPFLVQGELGGAIAVLNAATVSPLRLHAIESLSTQVGLALESAALTEQTLRNQSELRFSALVQHSTDVVFVVDPDTSVQYASPSAWPRLGYRPDELSGRPLLNLVYEDDRLRARPALSGLLTRSSGDSESLEFRIRHRDGRWIHVECLVTNLLEDDAVAGVVVNLRDITERKRFEEQLSHQAFHDRLTNLANRSLFRDRVKHALSKRRDPDLDTAVLFIDLDDFKAVNDTFGHECGDHLLRETAQRLQLSLRAGDSVARLGGDEFGILLEDVESPAVISDIVGRLLEVVRAPMSLEGREMTTECSIGVRIAAGRDAAPSAEDLLRDADVAMYEAKRAGGNAHRNFEPAMQATVANQLELRAALRVAVESEQLTLAYQPIFDLRTGAIDGYEALLRWDGSSRGPVSPGSFVPIAEESGLIVPLGRWALGQACRDAVALARAHPGSEHRSVAVNVSARQLQRPEIVAEVEVALSSSGLRPESLILEITESLMIDDIALTIERLTALRRLGLRIALDDFGTGYSSLNYIRRLPIDILKIDKRFIDNVDSGDDVDLTATILDMARVLNLRTVAEGIERPEQRERLLRLGCDFGQGFLLAKPMSLDELHELVRSGGPLSEVPPSLMNLSG
jgi:diguanylate cyclase (GGDEF)-like protein/PAS domain S-box-containing protein